MTRPKSDTEYYALPPDATHLPVDGTHTSAPFKYDAGNDKWYKWSWKHKEWRIFYTNTNWFWHWARQNNRLTRMRAKAKEYYSSVD